MAITMKLERITPAIAEKYLRENTRNYRKIHKPTAKRYAEDMKAGRWETNGDTIVFDVNGVLKNGQHRLAAIVMSGVTVEIVVVRGVDENVEAYDMTYVRSAPQIANAKGLDVSKSALSAVNLLFFVRDGKSATKMEVVEYAGKHEDALNRAWRTMLNGENTRHVKRASLLLATYMMLETETMPFYELEVFFKAFSQNNAVGTTGYEVSPALVVRKMFDERWKYSTQKSQREQLDVVIQAMLDMHDSKKRVNTYKISSPFAYETLLKQMMNGVE